MIRALILAAVLALAPAVAQLQFEVASIKLSYTPGRPWFRSNPGRIDFHRAALMELIRRAYSTQWVDMRQVPRPMPEYDVVATMPRDATSEQQRVMLQSLLADRLNLQVHRETRETPVYAVTIAKGGLRIQKSQNIPEADEFPDYLWRGVEVTPAGWRYKGKMPLSGLMQKLYPFEIDRPMIDLTGLEGHYDIDVLYHYEETDLTRQGIVDSGNMRDLFSAMEKQLGLKVEPRKLPLDFVVVDRADRVPKAN